MAIAKVQSKQNDGSSITELPVVLTDSNVLAGSSLLCWMRGGIGIYDTIDDNQGNTYQTEEEQDSGTNHTLTHIAAHNCAAGATTVTFYATSSTTIRATVEEVSCATPLEKDVATVSTSGSSASFSSGNITNVTADVILAGGVSTNTNITFISHTTLDENQEVASRLGSASTVFSSTAARANDGSFNTSKPYACMVLAYRESTVAGANVLNNPLNTPKFKHVLAR